MIDIKREKVQSGFTLVELVIVILIVSILAAIAYPSYTDSVQKSRRSDVYDALLDCASAQARYFSSSTPSTYMDPALAGGGPQGEGLCGWSAGGHVSKEGYYTLTIQNPNCTRALGAGNIFSCFLVTATAPVGSAQRNDLRCRTFTIDERGNRQAFDDTGADNTDECWRN